MNADTTDRTPLDDPLLMQVRQTLDAVDSAAARRPALTPPWDRIHRGMRRARRRRRRMRAARVGVAGLLAVSVLGVTTMSGVLPYPSFAPTVAIPGQGHRSALDDGRTRGSLASNTAWLRAFRGHVGSGGAWSEPGGENWAPPRSGALSVIYAGDVDGHRVALVEGNWHWGPVAVRQQVWFAAAAGAAPTAMQQVRNGDPADTAVAQLDAASTGGRVNSTVVIVLSKRPVQVALYGPPGISAAGTVTLSPTFLAGRDGVYTASVRPDGTSVLRVPGLPDQVITGSVEQSERIANLAPARGGVLHERGAAQDFATNSRLAVRQPIEAVVAFKLLAGEEQERSLHSGPVRAVVGLITLSSGARVLTTGEQHGSGSGNPIQVDAGRVLPAGVPDPGASPEGHLDLLEDPLSIAWRTHSRDGAGDEAWTAAMGPYGTNWVQWIHRDGSVSNDLTYTSIAGTNRSDIASVRFLNAKGAVIGSTTVLDPFDARGPGLLPEVTPR